MENKLGHIFQTLSCIFLSIAIGQAQPSGGPYGPVQQTYDLPPASNIYYVAVDGQAEQSGKTPDKPTTLAAAITRVKTGDAIVLRGGVYRTGNLFLNQGIIIQPYKDEQPVLKGTLIATDWKDLGNGLWKTSWSHLFPSKPDNWWVRDREGQKTPLYRFNNDMVFIDGRFLQAVGWEGEVNENTYYIDYETGAVYIGANPQVHLVEITAFNNAIIRTTKEVNGKKSDGKGPVIRGLTFTQYAYRALEIEGTEPEGVSPESEHGKQVVGTTIENCTISYCSRVAGYFRGDHMTFRNCKISDTSTEGLYIIASNDVLLEKNIFTRNNIERITGYYPAAVKIFNQCHRVTCNDNLVIDLPYSNGIWYDVGEVDGVFTNNWVQDVGCTGQAFSTERPWPSDNGFFFEISKGAVCAGNIFINCDHGIWVLNSSNVQIYNNTFINSTACIARNERSAVGDHFGWHPATGPDVDEREGHVFVNNLMYGDANFTRPLLYVWQPPALCAQENEPQLKTMDFNVYVRKPGSANFPLIWWSPVKNQQCSIACQSLEDFRKLQTQFAVNSRYFSENSGMIFKSTELGDYQVLPAFARTLSASRLPENIARLLGQTGEEIGYVGAYPLQPLK
jgi:parallel beta-helix repeat protein